MAQNKPDEKSNRTSPNDQVHICSDKVDWINIQKLFDALTNVDEIFYQLREIVDDLRICSTAECPIFSEMTDLDLARMKFKIKSPEEAREKLENITELRKFENDYQTYIVKTKKVMAKIYALKISKDTLTQDRQILHDQFMEIIREFNKNNNQIPADFTKAMQSQIDKYGNALNLNDPRVDSIGKEMQSQIAKTKKSSEKQ